METDDGLSQVFTVQVGIDFGGDDRFVPQHLLYSPQIGTTFHQVGGKGVPEGMWTHRLFVSRLPVPVL